MTLLELRFARKSFYGEADGLYMTLFPFRFYILKRKKWSFHFRIWSPKGILRLDY